MVALVSNENAASSVFTEYNWTNQNFVIPTTYVSHLFQNKTCVSHLLGAEL